MVVVRILLFVVRLFHPRRVSYFVACQDVRDRANVIVDVFQRSFDNFVFVLTEVFVDGAALFLYFIPIATISFIT